MNIPFSQLPASSRLWIFPFERKLSEAEELQLTAEIGSFLTGWAAHNVNLLAGAQIVYSQFLMVATDEAVAQASGCSIDELYRRIRMLAETFGLPMVSNLMIQYRDANGAIVSTARDVFGEQATEDTIVFDHSITSVQALRTGKWELPAKDSWHRELLREAKAVV